MIRSSSGLRPIRATALAVLLTLVPLLGHGQYFENIPSELGLSQNQINCILQDQQGFLWLGTKSGLNRFDGYEFVVYRFDPFDSASLSDNYITDLLEDQQGRLWVATLNGLNLLDRSTDSFRRFLPDSSLAGSIGYSNIKTLEEGAEGDIWIGTWGGGLDRLTTGKNKKDEPIYSFEHFRHDKNNEESLSNNLVVDIQRDANGALWVTTSVFEQSALHLVTYSQDRVLVHRITGENLPPVWRQVLESGKHIFRMTKGEEGDIWIGMGPGFIHWDPHRASFSVHDLNLPFQPGTDLYWHQVMRIYQDKKGKIWIGTFEGLDQYDPVEKTFRHFKPRPGEPGSIAEYGISSFGEDRNGILWLGSHGNGLYKYDPDSRPFIQSSEGNIYRWTGTSIRSLAQTRDGQIWVGPASTGLFWYDPDRRNLTPVPITGSTTDDWGLVYSIYQDRKGKVWVGSDMGLFCLNWRNGEVHDIRHFNPGAGVREGPFPELVYRIHEDREGKIWVATPLRLSRLEEDSGRFVHYPYRNNEGQTFRTEFPCIYQDEENTFWVGTFEGLLKLNALTGASRLYQSNPNDTSSLSQKEVRAIHPDPLYPNRFLWIGTAGGGLNRFDLKNQNFLHLTEKEGLPDNVIYAILSDNKGNLWVSTNKGLSRFHPSDHVFQNYDTKDGLQHNEFNSGAFFKSPNGLLFFGGISGFNGFLPSALPRNDNSPAVVITDLQVNNRPVDFRQPNAPVSEPVSESKVIRLRHWHTTISLKFAALDFSDPEKNQYSFRLDPFDKEWRAPDKIRTATYTNLDPGAYTFQVKASNNHGVWNDEGTSIRLIIQPPWWSMLWAKILFGLLLAGVFLLFFQYEFNRQRLKHDLELEMVEASKLKEINELKSKFFANISHEFRTPLTLILGQVERLHQSSGNARTRERLSMVFRNARGLLQLINQLLDLSKLEAGNMKLQAAPGKIIIFLKTILFSFESMASQRNIELRFDSQIDETEIYFDREKLERVFYNLLSNALKFTRPGGLVSIDVSLPFRPEKHARAPGPEMLMIKVSDTGPGIAPEELPRIFDRFYQVERVFNSSPADGSGVGTGIGLALTKELIELHHGVITVESAPEAGSCFVVQLPFGNAHLKEEEMIETSPFHQEDHLQVEEMAEAIPGPVIFDNRKKQEEQPAILVVEDNDDVRTYIRETLEEADFRILEATCGETGLKTALKVLPDFILTDVMMPGMNGFEFSRRIRENERTSHIPIIMLTAKAEQEDRIRGLKTGVDDYLTKPFSSRELIIRIENLIRLRQRLKDRFRKASVFKVEEVSAVPADQAFLEKVMSAITENISVESFGVDQLSSSIGMSATHLNRKLKALINQSAGRLIRARRMQRAAQLLEANAGNISEIALEVGYPDPAHFARVFRKFFDCSPTDYQKRTDIS